MPAAVADAGCDHAAVSGGSRPSRWADVVDAVRDDPTGRLAPMERGDHGPFGDAPRHPKAD
jgi:hypothetical protein